MKKLLLLIFGFLVFSCQNVENDMVTQLGTDGTEYVFLEEDVISNNPEINEHYLTFRGHYLDSINFSNAESHLDSIELKYAYFKSYLKRLGYNSEIHNLNIVQPEEFKYNCYLKLISKQSDIKSLKTYNIIFIIILIWDAILIIMYIYNKLSFRRIVSVIITLIIFCILLFTNINASNKTKSSMKYLERDTYRELLEYNNTT